MQISNMSRNPESSEAFGIGADSVRQAALWHTEPPPPIPPENDESGWGCGSSTGIWFLWGKHNMNEHETIIETIADD